MSSEQDILMGMITGQAVDYGLDLRTNLDQINNGIYKEK